MDFIKQNNNNILITNQNNNQNEIITNNQNTEIKELKNKIKILEQDKKNLENIINQLKSNNIKYENDLYIANNKLKDYENENIGLKNQINSLNNLLNIEKNKNNVNNNINQIMDLLEQIKLKDIELKNKDNELKNKDNELIEFKSKLPFTLEKEDKLLSLIFYSVDQKIHYSLICKNTDKFSSIVQRLFEVYKEYQEEEVYYFIYKGKKINNFITVEELKLKNGDIITMKTFDF